MTTDTTDDNQSYMIRIGDADLNYADHQTDDPVIVMDQLLDIAGARPNDEFDAYMFRTDGTLERLGSDEQVDLRKVGVESFLVIRTDRAYRIIVDDERYDWGIRWITGKTLRVVANISEEHSVFEERRDEPDREIGDTDLVDLDAPGTEKFYSRRPVWELKIRRNVYTFNTPLVPAREALGAAGFDLGKEYNLLLVTKSGRKQVGIDDNLDLRDDGIECLRVKIKDINNGEASASTQQRQFPLQEQDVEFLDSLGLEWEAVLEGKKQWLIVRGYELPAGFNVSHVDIALDIPRSYPAEQIDMFYCLPKVTRADGSALPQTEATQNILGTTFQRWSRHRKSADDWDPATDCVESQFELVEEALCREVGQ